MDEDNENPFEISRFHLNKALNTMILDWNKKRKLQAEHLGLPIPKHKCYENRLGSESHSTFEENEEVESLITNIIEENAEKQAIEDSSDHGSAKDSNSFVGDYDFTMSAYGEAKFDTAISNIWPCERPSTSSIETSNNTGDPQSSSENMAVIRGDEEEMNFVAGEHEELSHHYKGLQTHRNLMEPMGDFGIPLEYGYAEYENDTIGAYTDKELDDILYSNEVNSNVFVLSSGRWSINQDAQSGARKPTIDQEFEQYFSMLML